jgi:hypothetical protein
MRNGASGDGADGGIHPGSVAAAGQERDPFHFRAKK